nr:unnamed protein product [Callosobruchus chinensis]
MENFNWAREDTCLLIENFELYPALWNVHNVEFKDRIKKQQNALHNLRTQVNKEWRKIKKKKSRIFVSFPLILSLTKLSKKSKSSADIRKRFLSCIGSSFLNSVSNFSCIPRVVLR